MNHVDVPEIAEKALVAEFQRKVPEMPVAMKELVSAVLASHTRLKAMGALSGKDKPEEVAVEHLGLSTYQSQYEGFLDEIKSRYPWEIVQARLLANDGEMFRRALAMQGKGELVGIDWEGRAMFKDGGEPVMYGYDKEGKLLQIYDRDPEQMAKVVSWANYLDTRKQIHSDGYKLFVDDGNGGLGYEVMQVEAHTKKFLVASKDGKEWRVSLLESGDVPNHARILIFDPRGGGREFVGACHSLDKGELQGAVRLLRV